MPACGCVCVHVDMDVREIVVVNSVRLQAPRSSSPFFDDAVIARSLYHTPPLMTTHTGQHNAQRLAVHLDDVLLVLRVRFALNLPDASTP
jgi:hypothetical protein